MTGQRDDLKISIRVTRLVTSNSGIIRKSKFSLERQLQAAIKVLTLTILSSLASRRCTRQEAWVGFLFSLSYYSSQCPLVPQQLQQNQQQFVPIQAERMIPMITTGTTARKSRLPLMLPLEAIRIS